MVIVIDFNVMNKIIVFFKPDLMERGLEQEALLCILNSSYVKKLISYNKFLFNSYEVEEFYRPSFSDRLSEKKYQIIYRDLVDYLKDKFMIVLHLELFENNEINVVKKCLIGETCNYEKNTLRYKYAIDKMKNSFHCSDSVVSYNRELNFFRKKMIILI